MIDNTSLADPRDVAMAEPSKRTKRLLREQAAIAHERELKRALASLAEAFHRWENGDLSTCALSNLIHEYHDGPSRQLFLQYRHPLHDSAVARAIATGVLDRKEVPAEVMDHLARAIEYFASEASEEAARRKPEGRGSRGVRR